MIFGDSNIPRYLVGADYPNKPWAPEIIEPALAALTGLVDEIFPVEHIDVLTAHRMMQGVGLSARDAIRVAIMKRYQIEQMMSFDAGFDTYPGTVRLS